MTRDHCPASPAVFEAAQNARIGVTLVLIVPVSMTAPNGGTARDHHGAADYARRSASDWVRFPSPPGQGPVLEARSPRAGPVAADRRMGCA
jgi:hypothetical protein